jgi:serine phosphatase RsbU (regulator of sigma subunit)
VLLEDPSASVSVIARAAGVSRGTAYRHFATRQHLIDEVRRQSRRDAAADDEDYLRPPGEVSGHDPTPLSVTDVLNKVAPFQLGDQIVAEALRLPSCSAAAVYLAELDGRQLKRLAGSGSFPATLPLASAIGPEIPREGLAAVRATIHEALPGVTVAPMTLRSRAIGVVLAVGADGDTLRELAREAAVALAMSDAYTDTGSITRRSKETTPAAEMQQMLLPPRIMRIAGATLAGNVQPAYEVGGDLFDYTENDGRTWIAVIDVQGGGARASAVAAMVLAAFRSARRRPGAQPEAVALAMHETLAELVRGRPPAERVTANITAASWNAPSSTLHWVACGEIAPLLVDEQGHLRQLGDFNPALGSTRFPRTLQGSRRQLLPGERVILASDGVLDQPSTAGGTFGLEGLQRAVAALPGASAGATLRAIEDAATGATSEPLHGDATLVVLAIGSSPAT